MNTLHRGYEAKLGSGQKLSVEITERGYTVRVTGINGSDWRPGIHTSSPIWEDARKWEGLPESLGIDKKEWNKFRAEVEQSEHEVSIGQNKDVDNKAIDEIIKTKAMDILKNGDPITFIIDSCNRYVLGAEKAFRKLACCVAVQDIKQSAGLHPRLSGESGMGKSLVTLVFAHHLPPEIVSIGSSSSMAIFYHNEGDKIFRVIDDYIAGGNETIDTIIKQTSTFYHKPYAHKTVRDQLPVVHFIGSEQTWAITSVDASQDIQVLNRQLPINLNDTEDLTSLVNRAIIDRYGRGEEQFFLDETVEVCREIWRILRDGGYINIKIPYFNQIEWLDNSNRRNPSMFMDLLIAHTAMMRHQRDSLDGFYIAREEDFQAALNLFIDNDAEELTKRLTRKERLLAELISKSPNGLTREEVAQIMKVSVQRIGQLINGEKGKGGLISKLPGLIIEDTTYTVHDKEKNTSKSIRIQILKLKGYSLMANFGQLVRLNRLNDDSSSNSRNLKLNEITNGEREKRERDRELNDLNVKSNERKKYFSQKEKENVSEYLTPKTSFNHLMEEPDSEKNHLNQSLLNETKSFKAPTSTPTIGPNPRKDLPTPSVKSSLDNEDEERDVCDECGKPVPWSYIKEWQGDQVCPKCYDHLIESEK